MKKKYILLFLTFATLLFLEQTKSDCDVCHVNGVACLSQNVYSLCLNGTPSLDYKTCPGNKFCTDGHLVCYSQNEIPSNALVSCNRPDVAPSPYSAAYSGCGFKLCDSNNIYACINITTIGFCFGQSTPLLDPLTYSKCPDGTVCDLSSTQGFCTKVDNFKSRCQNNTDSGNDFDRSFEDDSTTTAPRDVNTICEDENSAGSFKPDDDLTCTKFVYCYAMGSTFLGTLMSCPAGQYFDSKKKICHVDIPPECTTTTSTTNSQSTTVIATTTATATTTMPTTTKATTTATTSTAMPTTTKATTSATTTTTMPTTTKATTTAMTTTTMPTTTKASTTATTTTTMPTTTKAPTTATTTTTMPTTTKETTTATTTTTMPTTTKATTTARTTTTMPTTTKETTTATTTTTMLTTIQATTTATTTTTMPTTATTTTTMPTTTTATTTTTLPTTTTTATTTTTMPTTTTTATTTTTMPTTPRTTTTMPTTTTATTTTARPTTTAATTTTTTKSTSTTPATPRDPNKICEDANATGLHRPDYDPTCTQYVLCYAMGSKFLGVLKTCSNGEYFNATMGKCQTVLPADCIN